ncbi:MAG: hypothetical protein ACFFAN_21190 [Promethearchaeota archaeon]
MADINKNEVFTTDSKPSIGLKILLCLFIGCLSTFFAEVLSGSFPLWFINIWGLFMVLPLYMMHLIFLLNLAMRKKKTSIPQLYLWGVIFALYESWITKVLWFGYPNSQGAQFGLLLFGIAIVEFIVLVFFYHPIFSFVIPILVYEIFAFSAQSNNNPEHVVFPSHLKFLEKNKKILCLFLFVILFGASFVSISLNFNLFAALLAASGSIGIIFFLYFLIKWKVKNKTSEFSIYSLRLGKKGFSIVIIYLIVLYVFSFIFILPERLPNSIIPYIIIIGFYAFIGVMIYYSKSASEMVDQEEINIEKVISLKNFSLVFGFIIILIVIFCFIPVLSIVIGISLYLSIVFGGIIFFIIFLVKALKK